MREEERKIGGDGVTAGGVERLRMEWVVVGLVVLLLLAQPLIGVYPSALHRVRDSWDGTVNEEAVAWNSSSKEKLDTKFIGFEGGKIHVLQCVKPESSKAIFIVHGADRATQNITHWGPNLGLFSRLGSFYLVDLPGYGLSSPPKKRRLFGLDVSAVALNRVIEASGVIEEGKDIVIITRDSGATLTMKVLEHYKATAEATTGLIFIAPQLKPSSIDV